MTKASDNPFPSVLLTEGGPPTAPASGKQRLWTNSSNLNMITSAGVQRVIGASVNSVANDAIWDAKGDLAVGTGADTAVKLTVGATAGHVLTIDAGEATGLKWAAAPGGATVVRHNLTPATPTHDFATTLSGWTAYSGAGSFATTACFAQAIDGSHLWMPFHAQHGYLYESTTNVDQEWIVGGLVTEPGTTVDFFPGIAILDSSGDGVAVIYHTSDHTCALVSVASHLYNATPSPQNLPGLFGYAINSGSRIWMRLTRSGNTWDAYASIGGYAWDSHAAGTMSRTITASRRCIGLFSVSALSAYTTMRADWLHTTIV